MAGLLEEVIRTITEKHFPLVRVRRRSTEPPWITKRIKRLWKRKLRGHIVHATMYFLTRGVV